MDVRKHQVKLGRGNPLGDVLRRQGVMVLDGGLATALEERGHNLGTTLWSAAVLREDPDAIRELHTEFLEAGADCITTASYQASFDGFRQLGVGERAAREAFGLSVALAVEARDRYWRRLATGVRARPLVAASVGPYGAYLADGSEYDGRYGVGRHELEAFHRERFGLFATSSADLIACETIPSAEEVCVLMDLLRETPGAWAWISVTCREATRLRDGSPLAEVARLCDRAERVAAIAVNCTEPRHVEEAVHTIRAETTIPILVYPNSGETYESASKTWSGRSSVPAWGALASRWVEAGAQGVGGCCRVGPDAIRAIRRALLPEASRGRA